MSTNKPDNNLKPWLLDAHCDAFEMRSFLNHDFNLGKGKYLISESTKKYLESIFKEELPPITENSYHVTLPRLHKGNVKALFLNVADYDLLKSSKMIDAAYMLAKKHDDKVAIYHHQHDISLALKTNKIALILVAEGPVLFHGQVDLLHHWHRLGIRIVNLSHGEGTEGFPKYAKLIYKNVVKLAPTSALQISTSSERYLSALARKQLHKKEKGLSPLGKQMLKEMAKLNILCDLSHANDAAFWEALETSSGKFCATHSNCAALCRHTRNLTDEMMRALAKRGGVLGLCFYGVFIDEEKPSLHRFIEHVLHALDIMGPDHIGIGGDFDGVEPGAFMAIPHPGQINKLWEGLEKAGINNTVMNKIAHENFLRLLAK